MEKNKKKSENRMKQNHQEFQIDMSLLSVNNLLELIKRKKILWRKFTETQTNMLYRLSNYSFNFVAYFLFIIHLLYIHSNKVIDIPRQKPC